MNQPVYLQIYIYIYVCICLFLYICLLLSPFAAAGLAAPTAEVVCCGVGCRLGLIIKDTAVFNSAATITKCVVDKTGTLTTGQPLAAAAAAAAAAAFPAAALAT